MRRRAATTSERSELFFMQLAVLKRAFCIIRGLNPTPDEVLEHLRLNNIAHDKVIDITKISFLKGASSIIPNSARALAMLDMCRERL
ncbi:hypothetical protein evm_014682 [Chilo suppressalis]|nr:hypothetical protein evm_014682 [Chilo suppressalis]